MYSLSFIPDYEASFGDSLWEVQAIQSVFFPGMYPDILIT